jgi:uncharacterized protein (TIGR03000 family)
MYGVVLMAALATSSSAPEFCHGMGHGCHGGYGGYGGGCYGCYGGGYGCYGGGYGGCYGAWWGASPYSVWGCYGGYGGYGHGGAGCTGCYGCYGGYSCYGMAIPGGTTYVGPGMTNPVPPTSGNPPEVTPLPKVKKGDEQARAKVRIELPADAKLYVDGTLMKTESAVRMFHTPSLTRNQTYFYELKAVIVRDNQMFTDTQQILVRPGELATASFAGLEQRATASLQASQSTAQR